MRFAPTRRFAATLVALLVGATAFTPSLPAQDAAPVANRLAREKSPYLLEHANDPVDWYPWGDEAFAVAKRDAKPVFLSIGYSACHWCHVMQRESFADAEIASFLNEHFVSIKVDREERPDIDAVYMAYVQARTGSGGWPMTVALTPEKQPIFGGTYYPPRNRDRMPGLLELLKAIEGEWRNNRDAVLASGANAARVLALGTEVSPAGPWPDDALDTAAGQFAEFVATERDDPGHGPLFPDPPALELMLRHERATGEAASLELVVSQLEAMAAGGIHDPIGGGFARYSTDERWLVPHFEKMLYGNAMLARVYLLAYQRTKEPRFAAVARDVLDYLLRDMQLEGGAFAAAEDADSAAPASDAAGPARHAPNEHGEEGRFYTFTPDEVRAALPSDLAAVALAEFDITKTGHLDGRSVPNRIHRLGPAANGDVDPAKLEAARAALFELRAKRPRPRRDDKVLADWNGLAISAFALAGRVLHEPRYRVAARHAADFLVANLWDDDARTLLRRWCDGEAAIAGQLSDHAFLAQGLLDLWSTDFDPRDLTVAIGITDAMLARFCDPKTGVFFDTPSDGEMLMLRPREGADAATPSPTAVAVRNLVRISRLTGRSELEDIARRAAEAYSEAVRRSGFAHSELICAVEMLRAPPREIVFAGTRREAAFEALVDSWWTAPHGDCVSAHSPADAASRAVLAKIDGLGELIEDRDLIGGKPAAYLCQNRVCREPIVDPAALAKLALDSAPPSQPPKPQDR